MLLLFGLSMVFLALGLWRVLGGAALGSPALFLGLLGSASLAMILGGLYWGAVANPDDKLLQPLLAINMCLGAMLFGIFVFLFPGAGAEAAAPGKAGLFLPALLFPGFFFWAAAPPFLCALAFPEEKGTGRGLFTLWSLALFALALGLFLGSAWERRWPATGRLMADVSLALALALGLWLWLSRPERDPEELPLRFFPVRSLGYWTGDKVYGLELLVYGKAKRTLGPSSFLAALGSGVAFLLALRDGPPWEPFFPFEGLTLALLALALGALAWGPLVAALCPPMTALALNQLALSFLLCWPLAAPGPGALRLALSLAPLLCAGALFPLSLRVGVSRHDFLAYAFGKLSLPLFLGFALGLGLAFWLAPVQGWDRLRGAAGALALLSAFLAAGPTLSWLVSALIALLVGLAYYFL